jgi:hypothetical protein
MSVEDFFSKVDATLSKVAEAQMTARSMADQNRQFLETVIVRLSPTVFAYKEKLRERGIYAEVDSYPTAITFTMRYKDGGHHGLRIGGKLESNLIEVTTSFTSDDGKNYTSTDGGSYDSANWNDSIFEAKLRKCIEDFLFYADRHGGLSDRE